MLLKNLWKVIWRNKLNIYYIRTTKGYMAFRGHNKELVLKRINGFSGDWFEKAYGSFVEFLPDDHEWYIKF
jgi:hypothetical protein